jgi:hypothetical protein
LLKTLLNFIAKELTKDLAKNFISKLLKFISKILLEFLFLKNLAKVTGVFLFLACSIESIFSKEWGGP